MSTLQELFEMQLETISPVSKKLVKYSPNFVVSVKSIDSDGVRVIVHADGVNSDTIDLLITDNNVIVEGNV